MARGSVRQAWGNSAAFGRRAEAAVTCVCVSAGFGSAQSGPALIDFARAEFQNICGSEVLRV